MQRDQMNTLLRAIGRYIRESFEPRIKAVEESVRELPALVERAAAAIPTPKDGTSVTKADVEPMLREMVDALPKPRDPDPVDVGAVAVEAAKHLLDSEGLKALCDLVATEAVAALPPAPKGEDGKSVTVDEVVAALLPRIEERFEAVVAKHVLDVERRAQGVLERAVAAIPKPKDGENGRPGVDGLGFDDMSAEYDGERRVTLKFQRGDVVKTFDLTLPVVIDRGYWREGTEAKTGDGWTHDGTWWIAQRDTKAAPARDSADWRIGARKGRDGQPGPPGKPYTPPGPVALS